jgi:hypothetical protein
VFFGHGENFSRGIDERPGTDGQRLNVCLWQCGEVGSWQFCQRCSWQFRADADKVAHHPGEVRAGLFDLRFALRPGLGVVARFLPQPLKLGIERTFGAMTGWNRS